MSWQPPSEDWQSALDQPEDWQKRLREQGSVPEAPVWRSPEPAAASPVPAEAPSTRSPPAALAAPAERPSQRIDIGAAAPGAGAALALGVVGLGFWFLGPFAWWQGVRARRAIRRSGGQLGGYGIASVGMVLGILETVAMVLITALIVIGVVVTIGEEAS